jgi:hypothetical protein
MVDNIELRELKTIKSGINKSRVQRDIAPGLNDKETLFILFNFRNIHALTQSQTLNKFMILIHF